LLFPRPPRIGDEELIEITGRTKASCPTEKTSLKESELRKLVACIWERQGVRRVPPVSIQLPIRQARGKEEWCLD